MKIEAGKYYRTKGGQVFGPMVIDADPVRVKPLRLGAEVCAHGGVRFWRLA